MVGNKFGGYASNRIFDMFKPKKAEEEEKPVQTGRYDRDVFTYERKINNVTEKFKVELGTCFRDSEQFGQFMDVVTTHLMSDELIQQFGSEGDENNQCQNKNLQF